MNVSQVIELMGLEPLPQEGGMWRRIWHDEHSSAIYYLMRPDDFSAMHRLRSTEIWHHYLGAPAAMLLLGADGSVDRPVLGNDLPDGQRPCVTVPAGIWMGASTLGDWSLVGATMSPPWDPQGFELGDASDLVGRYPQAASQIAALTRPHPA